MEYITLNTGAKMPLEGFGVFQIPDAAEAKKILGEKGVTYTNIALVKEMYPAMPHKAMPTTYFVDSEGKVLTKPVVGANVELCRERLAEALAAAGK